MTFLRLPRLARRALPPAAARAHHPDPLNPSTKGWRSAVKEGEIPTTAWEAEVKRGLELGNLGTADDRALQAVAPGCRARARVRFAGAS